VKEACSPENNALKTKSRTIYANRRNIAQNLVCLWQSFAFVTAENFV